MDQPTYNRLSILALEVENLQQIIKRMATNSFEIKKWAIGLITLALSFTQSHAHLYIAYIPLFCFWYLNAYFLYQERLFRRRYTELLQKRLKGSEDFFLLNPQEKAQGSKKEQSLLKIALSVGSIVYFYGSIFLVVTILLLLELFSS